MIILVRFHSSSISWYSFTFYQRINSHGNQVSVRTLSSPRSNKSQQKRSIFLSFLSYGWFSDSLPQKADYFDRIRLGSGSMCSQPGRSEGTGSYRWWEGVHPLIQTSCTALTVSPHSVMLHLRSRQGRWKLCSQSPLWYRGQINVQLMVCMISEL